MAKSKLLKAVIFSLSFSLIASCSSPSTDHAEASKSCETYKYELLHMDYTHINSRGTNNSESVLDLTLTTDNKKVEYMTVSTNAKVTIDNEVEFPTANICMDTTSWSVEKVNIIVPKSFFTSAKNSPDQ
ncbi:hypothetical protein CEW46_21265 [Bacillus cereus]|nr:hypothetical protein CEW46_21265 [Bacillus cereus]